MNSRILIRTISKSAQDECQRLREENAHLRVMLGINQSHPHDPVANITEPFG